MGSDDFRTELGRRIERAWVDAGFESSAAMAKRAGLDYNAVRRYARGEIEPKVRPLARIAQACNVSLDWLVFGAESSPDLFLRWLETPAGSDATDEARRFLRDLPLYGYRPTLAFYDLAHQAWKLGLRDPDQASRAAALSSELDKERQSGE